MPQFTVYRNKNPKSKTEIPYLLDIQNNLLTQLETRVVIPMFHKKTSRMKAMAQLTPEFEIEGKKVILMTPQMAGIALENLGEVVGDLSKHRNEIVGAIDFLVTGF